MAAVQNTQSSKKAAKADRAVRSSCVFLGGFMNALSLPFKKGLSEWQAIRYFCLILSICTFVLEGYVIFVVK